MAVKIRLKRMGKIRAPFYRVVVMDSRTKRDGRAIEEIGKYHPTEEPSLIEIDGERAQYWLRQGAQPTEAVAALLKVTGDWQQAKGVDGGEGSLRVRAEKTTKRDLYEAALAAAGKTTDTPGSTTPRKRAETTSEPAAAAKPDTIDLAAAEDAAQAEIPEATADSAAGPAAPTEAPEARTEAPVEPSPEVTAEASPEVTAEASPEVTAEASPDVTAEASAETAGSETVEAPEAAGAAEKTEG